MTDSTVLPHDHVNNPRSYAIQAITSHHIHFLPYARHRNAQRYYPYQQTDYPPPTSK